MKWRPAFHHQILAALALAVPAGVFLGPGDVLDLTSVFGFLGELFLNALKMIVVPLILSAMISGVANLEQTGARFARLGGKTVAYYFATSLVAILTGLLLVNLLRPGIVDGQPARSILALSESTSEVLSEVSDKGSGDLVRIFLRMIPPNIVAAAAEGQMLGLITFGLLFGFFVTRLPEEGRVAQRRFWDSAYEVMLRFTGAVMLFAPLGVFGLVAGTIARTGFDSFPPLIVFFFTVLLALVLHAVITLPLLVRLIGRVSPWKQFQSMTPALLMAFSTSSSSATLPQTLSCLRRRAGVSDEVSSFTVPLGATVNMDGTALYECVAAMFIAQAYGLHMGFGMQFTVVMTALLTSVGVAGIPSASLVAIVIILAAVGLPAEGIGLILVVDRVLDMARTSVNVWSDSCGAVIIARTEGEDLPALRNGRDE